jgi:triacylglycerol lipase
MQMPYPKRDNRRTGMARCSRPIGKIVWITRTLLVLQLFAALGIAILAVNLFSLSNIWFGIPFGVVTVLLVRMQITANNFFLASRYQCIAPDEHCLSLLQVGKLFLEEFRSTMTASSWTMPFRSFRKWIAKNPSSLPVLLIHGYGCNSGFWHKMSKTLAKHSITHYAIDLEPILGGIEDYVSAVHDAIEKIHQETGSVKVIIVAHSMGGLVTRAYMREHGCSRVARAITLGTPHHGTGVAHFGAGLNCKQMQWSHGAGLGVSSKWLRELAESESEDVYRLHTSIYSRHDNIVSPHNSPFLPGATNIELFGVGHVALGFNPDVQARVIEEIWKAPRQTPQETALSARLA